MATATDDRRPDSTEGQTRFPQELEGLAKRGHASRAEITDAAMSQSAECVMLNKGPYIIEAVRTLDDILQRMQGHHFKKRSLLRKLRLATFQT